MARLKSDNLRASLKKLAQKEKIARIKWRQALKKANDLQKKMKIMLSDKALVFEKKLKSLEQAAYQKAVKDIEREQVKKEQAKTKVLQAAEQRFEKEYAAKMLKTQKIRKPKKQVKTSVQTLKMKKNTAKGSSGKRRGRPPMQAASEQVIQAMPTSVACEVDIPISPPAQLENSIRQKQYSEAV